MDVSWTVKKAECWRIDAFELWCWRRLLRVPWTARRSNQSILKETSPGCSLEGLMLKLKLHTLTTWCEELNHWERPWCWEGLGAEGEGDDGGWDGWMASPTWWTWVWVNSGSWWWIGRPGMLWFMGLQRVGHDWATELKWLVNRGMILLEDGMYVALHGKFPIIWLICAIKHQAVQCSVECQLEAPSHNNSSHTWCEDQGGEGDHFIDLIQLTEYFKI